MTGSLGRIPDSVLESLNAYRDHGRPPGQFVLAVLMNDLARAVTVASEDSLEALQAIVYYLNSELPREAWGSETNIWSWIGHRGLERKTP